MQKFSFNKRTDVLMPETASFRYIKDKNGNNVVDDKLILLMANICDKWEEKNKMPVPIPEQNFIAWLRQARDMIKEGKSSEEVMRRTLIQI